MLEKIAAILLVTCYLFLYNRDENGFILGGGILLEEKESMLRGNLSELEGLLVAFSGGVDSSLLTAVAREVLGDRVLAVTCVSSLHATTEHQLAERVARELGVKHLTIDTEPLQHPSLVDNTPERCYYCKELLFEALKDIAQNRGIRVVAHGASADDQNDFRPGHWAAEELGIRAPLARVGLNKSEIRSLARRRGLSIWDLPSTVCLASRLPYGLKITPERLRRIERMEELLLSYGLQEFRARHDCDHILRLEVNPEDFSLLIRHREEIVALAKDTGYRYTTMDLNGFRSGSMNEALEDENNEQ